MKSISKIFDSIQKGLEMLDKASKVLKSIEVVSHNLKNMNEELRHIWVKEDKKEIEDEIA